MNPTSPLPWRQVGTLGYMDPSLAFEAPDQRSDAYSLGVLFLRLFTGPLPASLFPHPARSHTLTRVHSAHILWPVDLLV